MTRKTFDDELRRIGCFYEFVDHKLLEMEHDEKEKKWGDDVAAQIIALVNQKGGVAKTTSTIHLGAGLVCAGKRVLLIDLDSQSNLTMCLGYPNPDELEVTMFEIFERMMMDQPLPSSQNFILRSKEGIDFVPANIALSTIEMLMINVMNRENKLKHFLEGLRQDYDFILIDCMPSLGLLTLNALVAADSVIIPVQTHYLSAKGLELLLNTIGKVKKEANHGLRINGILITMMDRRTNFAKEIVQTIQKVYGKYVRIFDAQIPISVKVVEAASLGRTIFTHDINNPVTLAYQRMVQEVLNE